MALQAWGGGFRGEERRFGGGKCTEMRQKSKYNCTRFLLFYLSQLTNPLSTTVGCRLIETSSPVHATHARNCSLRSQLQGCSENALLEFP